MANTWMSWSLLNKMSVTPSWGVVAVLGLILLACIVMGLQVRGSTALAAGMGMPARYGAGGLLS